MSEYIDPYITELIAENQKLKNQWQALKEWLDICCKDFYKKRSEKVYADLWSWSSTILNEMAELEERK